MSHAGDAVLPLAPGNREQRTAGPAPEQAREDVPDVSRTARAPARLLAPTQKSLRRVPQAGGNDRELRHLAHRALFLRPEIVPALAGGVDQNIGEKKPWQEP